MKQSEITIILDRSGSMASIKEATIKGINDFIKEVNSTPGTGYWSLIQFDDRSSAVGAKESFPYICFDRIKDTDLSEQPMSAFVPRGGTALRDAIGITLLRLKERWLAQSEEDRPAMMVVIMTDGQENASREFTPDQIKSLISECQSTHGWEFVYLGANQDSFSESASLGLVYSSRYNNIQNYSHDLIGTRAVLTSGAACVNKWKADNNSTADQLLNEFQRDEPKDQGNP